MTLYGKLRRIFQRRRGAPALLVLLSLFTAPTGTAKVLTVGCEYDHPPFSVVDSEGQAGGFSAQLFRSALAAMGREVDFRPGYLSDLKRMLANGGLDALPLLGQTPEQEPNFDYTFPYISLHGAIVLRVGEEEIRDLSDLSGKTVLVMAGSNVEEFLRREDRGINIRTTPTFAEALQELSAGHHDAVIISRLVAIRLLQETGIENLKILPNPIEEFRLDFSFAVRKGDHETLALLNEGLSVVMADGTFRRLHARWFAPLELPHRKIVVGGDHNYPPFEFLGTGGQPDGFGVELARAVGQAVDLNLEITLGPWPKILRELELGKIDTIQGISYSPERARYFDFTPPYMVTHYVAVVRTGELEPPATAKDLAGRRIVVQRGDIMDDYLTEQGVPAEVSRVESQEAALRELAAGRHDCALAARLTALYLMEKHGWENLKVGRTPLLSPEFCFAMLKNQKSLLAQLTEGLRAVQESGEYHLLRQKWFGIYKDQPVAFREILHHLAVVLLPLLLILAATLLWSWSLRRQVARRTAELSESEYRYRTLFDQAPVGIFSARSTGELISINPSLAATFGFPSPEAGIAHYREHGEEMYLQSEVRNEFMEQLRENDQITDFEYQAPRSDGTLVWISITARVCNRQPDASFVIEGFTVDINERKRTEVERERLLAATEQTDEAIMITDPDGTIRYVNPAFEKITGYTWEEAIGRTDRILNSGKQDREFYRNLWGTLSSGKGWSGRIINQRPDGSLYTVEAGISPVRDPEGKIVNYAAALRDITRELELEEQYRQAHKMEVIGQLAGGIAHDFNNILQTILGYTELLQAEFSGTKIQAEYLSEIRQGGERAATLIRQLLAFSRRQIIALERLDLNRVTEELLKMLRRVIGEDIRLEYLPGSHLGAIRGDVNMIEQVLLNLAINARDAMVEGGKLTIKTENVLIDARYCSDHPGVAPGHYALLSVTDTGTGMDKETLKRIFEPFFTTKEKGKGTGLGLAMVYGIVAQHQGIIRADSEPGQGTSFKIYLPTCKQASGEVKNLDEISISGGRETILLAEDDRMVRKLSVRILEEAGYTVLAAADGAEAVQIFKQNSEETDLLILDMVMPRKGGYQAWQEIKRIRPGVPVLFISGYSKDTSQTSSLFKEGLRLLQKPCPPDTLLQAIRETLDNDRKKASPEPPGL